MTVLRGVERLDCDIPTRKLPFELREARFKRRVGKRAAATGPRMSGCRAETKDRSRRKATAKPMGIRSDASNGALLDLLLNMA
jgi:hypothetical protein